MSNALLAFNRNPYDGTDVTSNGLRLAEQWPGTGRGLEDSLRKAGFESARVRQIERSNKSSGLMGIMAFVGGYCAHICSGVVLKLVFADL